MAIKTLKELNWEPDVDLKQCVEKILKASAIEWIKDASKDKQWEMQGQGRGKPKILTPLTKTARLLMSKEREFKYGGEEAYLIGIIDWIKHFFGITEDDLNGKKVRKDLE